MRGDKGPLILSKRRMDRAGDGSSRSGVSSDSALDFVVPHQPPRAADQEGKKHHAGEHGAEAERDASEHFVRMTATESLGHMHAAAGCAAAEMALARPECDPQEDRGETADDEKSESERGSLHPARSVGRKTSVGHGLRRG